MRKLMVLLLSVMLFGCAYEEGVVEGKGQLPKMKIEDLSLKDGGVLILPHGSEVGEGTSLEALESEDKGEEVRGVSKREVEGTRYYEWYRAADGNDIKIRVFKAPDSKCDTYYTNKDAAKDGLLMYKTGIYEYNKQFYGYDKRYYIPQVTSGNTTIGPNPITDHPNGYESNVIIPQEITYIKWHLSEPKEIDNLHVLTNNPERPNAMPDWEPKYSYKDVEKLGCFLITDANKKPILREPHVWLTRLSVEDKGDDIFVGQNAIYWEFYDKTYVAPSIREYYNKKEYTHYFYKVRGYYSNDFRYLLPNLLYKTIRDRGTAQTEMFLPISSN